MVTEVRSTGASGGRREGATEKGREETFWRDRSFLYLDRGVTYMGIYICHNGSSCPFKIGAFPMCKSYLNFKMF